MADFDFAELLQPFLEMPIFRDVLHLVEENASGRIWLIGGFVYRNLAAKLYGSPAYDYDIDFLVEARQGILKEMPGWTIVVNSYGVPNYVRDGHKMSFTDIRRTIRASGKSPMTVEAFLEETPFTVQSIGYDLRSRAIVGRKGLESLRQRTVAVNSLPQAKRYAEAHAATVPAMLERKAAELGFAAILP